MEPLQILHTPWRRAYVTSVRDHAACVFCDLLAASASDAAQYILHREELSFLVMNTFPYTPGHLMVVPYRHVPHTTDLTSAELPALLRHAQLGERLLRRSFGCRSVHVGANLGAAAGAGVPGHLHLHIIAWPQGTLWQQVRRGQPPAESLTETYRRLQQNLATLEPGPGSAGRPA